MNADMQAVAPARVSTAFEALDWRFKGLPANEVSVELDEIAARGWNVLREDLMFPVATLRQSALTHNSGWMRRFTELTGVKICPHGKTTMSPQLFELQARDGAWGMTAATVAHLRVYRRFGVDRVILANQLVGAQNMKYVFDELRRDPEFDFYCLVDSIEAVQLLETALASQPFGRPLQVLIELGIEGGRGGLRSNGDAERLARRIATSQWLTLRGVETFEGIIQGSAYPESEARMRSLLDRVVSLAIHCQENALFEGTPLLTAGGSSFFDVAAATFAGAPLRGFQPVLRSGCYLVHDSEFYEELVSRLLVRSPVAAGLGDGLVAALELWGHVHSRPETNRVIVGIGKRDTSSDVRFPKPIGWVPAGGKDVQSLPEGHTVVRLDDQHAYLDVPPASPLSPGDIVSFGVSHPCTTFDRWPVLYTVDDALNVVGAVRTYF